MSGHQQQRRRKRRQISNRFFSFYIGHNLRWYYMHLRSHFLSIYNQKLYCEIQFFVLFLKTIYAATSLRVGKYFELGVKKKLKTRRRDAGPWKLLVDVKIFFNFKFCWRARVSISSIVCLYNVLKRVSLMILARWTTMIPVIIIIIQTRNALSFPSALCQFFIVSMLFRTNHIKQRIQRSDRWSVMLLFHEMR